MHWQIELPAFWEANKHPILWWDRRAMAGVGGDVSSSQYSAVGYHSSTGCQLKSGVRKKSVAALGKHHGSNSKKSLG